MPTCDSGVPADASCAAAPNSMSKRDSRSPWWPLLRSDERRAAAPAAPAATYAPASAASSPAPLLLLAAALPLLPLLPPAPLPPLPLPLPVPPFLSPSPTVEPDTPSVMCGAADQAAPRVEGGRSHCRLRASSSFWNAA